MALLSLLLLLPLALLLLLLLVPLLLLNTGMFMLTVEAADALLKQGPSGGLGQPGRCSCAGSGEWSDSPPS